MALRIEIHTMEWQNGRYRIRVGDIQGSTEASNMTKKEVLQFIKERIEMEYEHDKKQKRDI